MVKTYYPITPFFPPANTLSMRIGLKLDPRNIKSFKDFGLRDALVRSLPSSIEIPFPIQKKMLTLNTSGISSFSHSVPRQGKSTAAILGLLSTPKLSAPQITNLVLVPTPSLADQYKEVMDSLGTAQPQHFQVLYRTGSIEADEQQHQQLISSHQKSHIHTLIATPQRVLDYISTDSSILNLQHIKQLVIEELDVFAHSNPEKITPLETLVEYLLQCRNPDEGEPIIQILTSTRAEFNKMPHILQNCTRPLLEVKEDSGKWSGELVEIDSAKLPKRVNTSTLQGWVTLLQQAWQGPGLVIPPMHFSPAKIQETIGDSLKGAIVARPEEVAGLNIDELSNIYVLGDQDENNVHRLQWMMPNGKLIRIQ